MSHLKKRTIKRKEKDITNEKTKKIYKYIITNFKKAPIILNSVDINSDEKYLELDRVYQKFVSKLSLHINDKEMVRKKKIERNSEMRKRLLTIRESNVDVLEKQLANVKIN